MTQTQRMPFGGLKVAEVLHDFVEQEVLPGTGIEAAALWAAPAQAASVFAVPATDPSADGALVACVTTTPA